MLLVFMRRRQANMAPDMFVYTLIYFYLTGQIALR